MQHGSPNRKAGLAQDVMLRPCLWGPGDKSKGTHKMSLLGTRGHPPPMSSSSLCSPPLSWLLARPPPRLASQACVHKALTGPAGVLRDTGLPRQLPGGPVSTLPGAPHAPAAAVRAASDSAQAKPLLPADPKGTCRLHASERSPPARGPWDAALVTVAPHNSSACGPSHSQQSCYPS